MNDERADNKGSERESKKSLITETITGRKITTGALMRAIGMCASGGLVFGLCAALTFCGVNAISGANEKHAGQAESSTEQSSSDNSEDNESSTGKPDNGNASAEEAGQASEDGDEGAAALEQSTEYQGTAHSEEDSSADNAYIHAYDSIEELRERVAEEISRKLVSIKATSTGTTWFDSVAQSTDTLSGVILNVGQDEILILTSSEADNSESLKVSFFNGVTVDAYVKQTSERDGLSVLAVSAKSGIDEGMLKELESIETGSRQSVSLGEPVIAVGAPLGAVGSYSFGDIGYVNADEAGFDADEDVFYADVSADKTKGTFIIDLDGRLIGIAADNDGSIVNEKLTRAVNISSLLGTLSSLKQGKQIAYAGIKGAAVSFDMRYSGIPEGIYITEVDHKSAAYETGIMRGDIITEADEETVSGMDDMERIIRQHRPGDSLKLRLKRSGSNGSYTEVDFTVTLGVR